jgi:hypothetical protein
MTGWDLDGAIVAIGDALVARRPLGPSGVSVQLVIQYPQDGYQCSRCARLWNDRFWRKAAIAMVNLDFAGFHWPDLTQTPHDELRREFIKIR